MKKSLVLILALVLVFSFSVTALAADFSDIADQPQAVQDAVYKLAALEMVEGYDDGTWRPNDQITRAEFAKIACLAGGFSSSYDALGNVSTPFSDVKVGVWYTGWVNLAYSQGYMKGDPNGTFRPNDPISENEVITVLLRLLGYNDNLAGQWPVDYVRQAGLLGILDDVKIVGSTPALRSTVAVMTDATLGENLVAWTKDKEIFEDREFGSGITAGPRSLLADSFKGKVYEDQLVAFTGTTATKETEDGSTTYDVNIGLDPLATGWDYKNFDKDTMEISFVGPLTGSDSLTGSYGLADTFRISGGYNIWDLAGNQVDVIATIKDGEIDELKYVEVKSSSVYVDAIEASSRNGKIDLGGSSYDLSEDVITDSIVYAIANGNVEDADDYTDSWFKVYLDENGAAYDGIQLAMLEDNGGIIDEVNTEENYIDFYSNASYGDADVDFDDKDVAVIKDGKLTKGLDALKVGDNVSVIADAANIDYVIYVNEPAAAGKFTRINAADQKFTIGDVAYYFSEDASYNTESDSFESVRSNGTIASDISDALGTEVTPTFNRAGALVNLTLGEVGDGNTVIGVLLDYSTSGTRNMVVNQLKVLNSEGKVVVYDVVDKAYKVDAEEVDYDDIESYVIGGLMKFRLNSDGDVDKAYDISGDVSAFSNNNDLAVSDDYKEITIEDNGSKETLNVNNSTKIFNIDWEDETIGDDGSVDEASTVSVDDLLKGDVATDGGWVMTDGSTITALVLNNFGASSRGNYGILKDWGYSTADFDEVIQLLVNNKATEFETGDGVDVSDYAEYDLLAYDLNGDTIEGVTPIVYEIADDAEYDTDCTVRTEDFNGLKLAGGAVSKIDAVSSSRIRVVGDSVNYKYTDDTVVFDYSRLDNPKEVSTSNVASLNTDRKVVAVYVDEDAEEVSLIVIFNIDPDGTYAE